MPRNVVSLHVQGTEYSANPWIQESLETYRDWIAWVWQMNPPIENPFPHQRVGVRFFLSDGWDEFERACVNDGASGASTWYERIRPSALDRRWMACLQGPNEPAVATYDQRMRLNEFSQAASVMCHADGLRYGGGDFSVGWVGGESEAEGIDWIECIHRDTRELEPTFDACDVIVSHNYGKRVGSAWTELYGWTLRYTYIHEVLSAANQAKPWVISEGGLDIAGDPDKSGWRGPGGPTAARYAEQIMTVNDIMAYHPYIEGYCLYGALPYNWESFRITKELWIDKLVPLIRQRDKLAEGERPLPSDDLYRDSPVELTEKVCWWCEECVRQMFEGGDTEYGESILHDLMDLAAKARDSVKGALG